MPLGNELVDRAPPMEERKVLTVVFCDLKDSTVLGERLDPEALGEVLDLDLTASTRVIERHGGTIEKFIGDAVVAAFGIPVIHEDDALRAVRAAVEIGAAVGRLNTQLAAGYGVTLQTRIGVHTGEVVVRTAVNEQQVLTGDTMNTAARLEQAAGTDEVFIGEPTLRLVRGAVEVEPMPPLELKGKSAAVTAYRLVRVFGDEQSDRLHDAPLVGRDVELRFLADLLDRSINGRRCVLATVLGDAGVGKSRLVRELVVSAKERAAVLRGRCLPYGEAITFWPLLEIVRDALGIGPDEPTETARGRLEKLAADPEVARRISSMLGWSDEQLPMAELFWGVRELIEGIARDRPLIMVIDDVHWAAPTLLELIDHMVESIDGSAVLIVCTARPDMLEEHPQWSDGPNAGRLVLQGLGAEACSLVLENTLGGADLPDRAREKILRAADGNPLFVEQLVSMLVDTGVLRHEGDTWQITKAIERLAVPPSINALLSARLDLLDAPERAVVDPASVIGEAFPSLAVRDLAAADERDRVEERLATVSQKRLVREEMHPEADGSDYRFQHVLIRDATYQGVLKRGRADLHERYADWLERMTHEREGQRELDEIAGYHLEQAYAYRSQLGPIDAHIRALGSRAADKLTTAGRRAFTRGDLPAATDLLERAMAALAEADPARLALAPELGEVLLERGEFARALEALDEAEAARDDPACAATVARARLIRLLVELYAGSEESWLERAEAEVGRAIPVFEAARDDAGLATAWRVRCNADVQALRFDAGFDAAEEMIRHAEHADDIRQQRRGAVAYAICATQGPTPVDQAVTRCEELIAAVEGDRRTGAVLQGALAQLLAMQGSADRARAAYATAQTMLDELGESVVAASTSIDSGPVEMLLGDLGAAEAHLRRDFEELERLGESYLRSTVGGLLAYVLLLEGRLDEAEATASVVREMAGPDDFDAQVLWRRSLGRRLAEKGEFAEAIGLATEAVALTTDSAPVMRAYALADRGAVMAAAGRTDEASADLSTALSLHVAKGNRVAADVVRRLAAETDALSRAG